MTRTIANLESGLSVRNKLNSLIGAVVNPKDPDFGAKGDGTSRAANDATYGIIGTGKLYADLTAARAGTGITDLALSDELDWTAVQAAINYALAHGSGVRVPSGRYIVNRDFDVGYGTSRTSTMDGFVFEGAGRGSDLVVDPLVGTTFVYTGSVNAAISQFFLVSKEVAYYTRFEAFTVKCGNSVVADAIKIADSSNTQYEFSRINAFGTTNFLTQAQVSGVNGEFHNVHNCQHSNGQNFLVNSAAQGLFWHVEDCSFDTSARTDLTSSIFFKMSGSQNGFGITAVNCSATFPNVGTCESTLVDNTARDAWEAPAVFVGGRYEHVTTLVNGACGLGRSGTLVLKGVQFTGMLSSDTYPVVNFNASSDNLNFQVTAEDCAFEMSAASNKWLISTARRFQGQITFERCYIKANRFKTIIRPEWGGVKYVDCSINNWSDVNFFATQNFGVDGIRAFLPKRRIDGSAVAGAGTPGQLLAPSRPVSSSGANVTVTSPWTTSGNGTATVSTAAIWGDSNVADPHPDACSIVLRSSQLLQFVTTIGTNVTDGLAAQYHAVVGCERDTAFRLVNSGDTSIIYTEIVVKGNATLAANPIPISLQAYIEDSAHVGFIALQIANLDTGNTNRLRLDYQVLTGTFDGTFVSAPSTSTISSYSQPWLSPRNLRPWSRMQLPSKSDAYGSASTGGATISNLAAGEMYWSTTVGNPVVYNGTNWGNLQVSAVVALTDAATVATDASLGDVFTLTLGGNRTMGAPTNAVAGKMIVYKIKQSSGGSNTLAWNSIFRFAGGIDPVITVTANAVDRMTFVYDGTDTKWDCISVVQALA